MHDPSFNHSRLRLGCFCGTFSPSRRQIRSICFQFTVQPALRSSAVAAQGSEVSPCSLLQDQLVERQIRDRTAKPAILLLKVLHPSRLVRLQTAIFFPPPIVGLLADRDPPTRFRSRCPLRQNDLRLTQLANNLLRLVLLRWHSQSPSWSKITLILDHSEGGRSL